MYKRIGEIGNFEEIPWGKEIVITGAIGGNRAWVYRMRGTFRKDNDDFRFVNEFGMSTRFGRNDLVSLNVLEKQTIRGPQEAEKGDALNE